MRVAYFYLLSLLFLATSLVASGADEGKGVIYCEDEDRVIFNRYVEFMADRGDIPMGEIMVKGAMFFLDVPYVASTLEREPEGLVVNLRELDCTTFAESVLALSRTVVSGSTSFDDYCDKLRNLRYRDGKIVDYTDRLHYMVDWFYENERKGIVADMGEEVGGKPLPLSLSFISTHPDSYKQLKGNAELTAKIAAKEREINERAFNYYLPKGDIDRCSSNIRNGDILCFVTTIKGLDVTHVGIAYWRGEELTFIHASSSAKRVIVQEGTLKQYCDGIKSCRGILVARPNGAI